MVEKEEREDLSPELLEKYLEAGSLGTLWMQYPRGIDIWADLSVLFPNIRIHPKEILTICAYPAPTPKRVEKKSWWPFKRRTKKYYLEWNIPREFNEVVIGENLSNRLDTSSYGVLRMNRTIAIVNRSSDFYWEDYKTHESNLTLNIKYLSREQLIRGFGGGDELCVDVLRFGLPIVGKSKFEEILKGIETPEREVLHRCIWTEDLEHRLQGRII
jgi:hypothetical protein